MDYTGSCHCGRIAFKVEGELNGVVDCNCSICRKKASLLWFVPRASLTLQTPAEDMATYRFNTRVIAHHFCPVCGVSPFGEGRDPQGNEMAAVNVRCLDGVDLAALPVHHYDGASR